VGHQRRGPSGLPALPGVHTRHPLPVSHTALNVWRVLPPGGGAIVYLDAPVYMYGASRYIMAYRAVRGGEGGVPALSGGHPFKNVCLFLDYSGNPGVNGVSYRGVPARPASLQPYAARNATAVRLHPYLLYAPFPPGIAAVIQGPTDSIESPCPFTPRVQWQSRGKWRILQEWA